MRHDIFPVGPSHWISQAANLNSSRIAVDKVGLMRRVTSIYV